MKTIVLLILDGWGIAPPSEGNAIFKAKKPNIDFIEMNYPRSLLQASSISVGLMWGEEGNSETGHLNLGAGRIVYQTLPRIVISIRDGSFYRNDTFLKAIEHVKKNNSKLHLLGLISSGSVHSYIDHLYALLELSNQQNLKNVYLHLWTDGRDSPPNEAEKFLANLKLRLSALKFGKIATIMGRFFAMDRNQNWNRTQKAYECMTQGKGEKISDPIEYIRNSYKKNIFDEYIEPAIVINEQGQAEGIIDENDSVIIFNFREDRARQITKAFSLDEFNAFPRKKIKNLFIVTMTEYEKDLPVNVAFRPLIVKNCLAEVLSNELKTQLHIAETEKYAHVTYFFNGGRELPFEKEDRILVPSLLASKFDRFPKMKTPEIASKIVNGLYQNKYDFIVANFANPDMVGHTGNLEATIEAIETVDKYIGELMQTILKRDDILIITADHGNAEEKINPLTGEIKTEHTINPIPFYLVGNKFQKKQSYKIPLYQEKEAQGILADVAPTILELMNLPQPSEMNGKSLLKTII